MHFFRDGRLPVELSRLLLHALPADQIAWQLGKRHQSVERVVTRENNRPHDHIALVGGGSEAQLLYDGAFVFEVHDVRVSILRACHE